MMPMEEGVRLYEVRIYPDPVLRQRSEALDERRLKEEAPEVAARMIETMRAAPGVGLAANQVGLPLRLVVIDCKEESLVMANPRIVSGSGWQEEEEGCLSVPGIRGDVRRKAKMAVRFLDLEGREHEVDFEGFLARVVQHELDHIDGILFTDRLGFAKRLAIRDSLRALEEAADR